MSLLEEIQKALGVKAAAQHVWESSAPALQHRSTPLYMPCLLVTLWKVSAAIHPVGFTHTHALHQQTLHFHDTRFICIQGISTA